MKRLACLLPLLLCAALQPAAASPAEQPLSVAALLDALPELPANAEEAARWIDKRGALVHPGLLRLQAAIEAHRRHVGRIGAAAGAQQQAQGTLAGELLMKGIAEEGIDVQRLQTDAAYAQAVQDRLRRMTPAEQIALAQRINQPLNSDRRHVNAARAMADDPPPVRAAAEAGEAYVRSQPQRFAHGGALWAAADGQADALRAGKLAAGVPKPSTEWDNPACDAACRGRWDAHAAKVLPLMLGRENEVLRIRRVALQQQRAAVLAELKTADRHLLATQYGAAARSSVNQTFIVNYDAAAVAEVESLLNRTLDALKSAAVLPHCGKQAVLVPLAACG